MKASWFSLIVVGLLLAAASCERQRDADASYHTRGVVSKLEGDGTEARVEIHHERIENFKDRDGKASPMDSMEMIFALGPGVDAAALKPGAKLAIDFDVRWSNSAPLLITKAQPLPDATTLELAGHDHHNH